MISMMQNFLKKISLFIVLKWMVVFVFLGIVLWGFPDSPSPSFFMPHIMVMPLIGLSL
jgi:hypothetical protein